MKIEYLSTEGIHQSEKDAIERMRAAFNANTFSQTWHGFAGFEMIDKFLRDREIDLILLTHDRFIVIELKNWRGKITAMRDHWLLNGNDMGRSPVKVTADKNKILSSKLKHLKDPAGKMWLDFLVVLCGSADVSAINPDEQRWVMQLDEFLKIASRGGYQKVFPDGKYGHPLDHLAEYRSFFRGPEFRPTVFSFMNYNIVGDVVFPHPDGLYREYKAVKRDDSRYQALLRRWDFSTLAGKADTIDERARIALREHQTLGYIQEQAEELSAVVLQPLSQATRDDVNADFCELYRLPNRQFRLSEFIHRFGQQISTSDRLNLVKVLVSHFAALHDIHVAHRDIGDHSVWLELPSRVSISGWVTAYFPEVATVGAMRELIRAGNVDIPEDVDGIGDGTPSDPFRRDVYLLGVVSHYLLFLRWPEKQGGIFDWQKPTTNPFDALVCDWVEKALEVLPSDRYPDAREMLNALNAIPAAADLGIGLSMKDFEPYRSEVLPMVAYAIGQTIKQGRCHAYRSSSGGDALLVKIWYGIRPDSRKPEESHQILRFLERARLFSAQPSQVFSRIVDFGLSEAGPFLVQQWIDGTPLKELLPQSRSLAEGLQLCKALIGAMQRLHSLGLHHGDLSPTNILIAGEQVMFIDAIDLFPEGGNPHTPAYSPPNHESISADQRDVYAIAKLCSEALDSVKPSKDVDIELVHELDRCMLNEFRVYQLDRVVDAINERLAPKRTKKRFPLVVETHLVAAAEALDSDNGKYHVGVFTDDNQQCRVSIAGPRKQLVFRLMKDSKTPRALYINDITHADLVRLSQLAQGMLEDFDLVLKPAAIDAYSDVVESALATPGVAEEFAKITATRLEEEPLPQVVAPADAQKGPRTSEVWRALIEAEEATLPEVEVTGPIERDPLGTQSVRVSYSKTGEPLDYDPEDVIEVLREIDGELAWIGELNTKETTERVLVIDRINFRGAWPRIGESLKLRSVQDRSSFVRRRSAVLRILNQESCLSDLIEYFEKDPSPTPIQYDILPSDAELDTYNQYDSDGNLTFTLNEQQREAFKRLATKGPIGLLQGPPGTGKTAFIASFIHFVLARGARNILLASQSHEAVNNAAEKMLEISRSTGLNVQLVRFGAEGMVSDALRPYHSDAILEAYRNLFKAEIRARVKSLSRNLGLPGDFVEQFFDLEYQLGRFLKELETLEERLAKAAEHTAEHRRLQQRLTRRRDRFEALARDKFGIEVGDFKASFQKARRDLIEEHGIPSPDAIARLDNVIAIATEWIDRLATDRANFEEFLAKTRTVVCGTCVGLGRSHFGIANNRYDWVIVDEAARATPSELAVAIQSGTRILLVGDHRQLPPLYPPELVGHIAKTLKVADNSPITQSDFQKAFESEYGRQVGAMLQTQYRVAPAIGELVSACFYPTPLLPGRGDPPDWFGRLPERLSRIVTWIDTSYAGADSFEQKVGYSAKNEFEAREILALLRDISSREAFMNSLIATDDESPIGVICMYAEQKRLLLRLLSEQDWASTFRRFVKIDTVDSYQGKQNRIIILSTTRNNSHYVQGHVWSAERVNVSVSRAMDRLFIVGASRMWKDRNQESPLGRILNFIETHADEKNFRIVKAVQERRR